ncbi:hypothetical protein FRB96_001250 [Tulasnella sp. 330]|nr:hypothetical protein FRB96_001250 [Tulasnella sp. 330]
MSDQSQTQAIQSTAPSHDDHSALIGQRSRHRRAPTESVRTDRDETTHGVARGSIGGGYGPYAYVPATAQYNPNRFSNMSNASGFSEKEYSEPPTPHDQPAAPLPPQLPTGPVRQHTNTFLWDTKEPDIDDLLHNPDPVRDAALDRRWTLFSLRGWLNVVMLLVLLSGLITLFAGYPIIIWYRQHHPSVTGYNLGGINKTGQIPKLNVPSLIDVDTPQSAYTRTGFDGNGYSLVFSDEFNVDGRSFYAGDDPFWEAVNLHYYGTGDLEWYQEDTITTEGGNLVITMTETPTHGLNWKSGMLQSWNKFCFTTGYIEVNVSLPGSPQVPGLWPAAWTMGNLGRVGYGSTTDGTWPFTYDSCDVGTYPNQTTKDGTPTAAAGLSYQPGQRLSACTCPGSDHPGPSVSRGRGAPEVDIMETEVLLETGKASQSMQIAPYDTNYNFTYSDAKIYEKTATYYNTYHGGTYQEAVSAITTVGDEPYNGAAYRTFGFELWSDPNDPSAGYVTWAMGGNPTWTLNAAAIGPDPETEINQRLISVEPMSITLNLGLSTNFQAQDFAHLVFPSIFRIDYVRVYQRNGYLNIGCDPSDYPTADYINNHLNAYSNPNLTVWSQAGYDFPRNSQYDGC